MPPEIGQIASLRRLYLGENQLTYLPPELGLLSSLEYLNLSDNQLASLTPAMTGLSSLQELHLRGNQLTSFPSDVCRLTSLRSLYLSANQLTSLPSFFFPPPTTKGNFPSSLRYISLADNCLITPQPPPSVPFTVLIDTQRLPATLDACSFDDTAMNMDVFLSSSSSSTEADFALHFYCEGDGNEEKTTTMSSPGSIRIADRHRLARRWPFFRHLLDADLSEARSGNVDLSRYFSLRLGQCLVDYFEGNPIQVSPLQTQDCRDFVEHADYFGLSDTLLLAFCIAKLKREARY
jgi:hypothetical protein